jgi:hypothetical protein
LRPTTSCRAPLVVGRPEIYDFIFSLSLFLCLVSLNLCQVLSMHNYLNKKYMKWVVALGVHVWTREDQFGSSCWSCPFRDSYFLIKIKKTKEHVKFVIYSLQCTGFTNLMMIKIWCYFRSEINVTSFVLT